eukprot:6459580-Amphidinium_carterae.1
MGVDGHAPDVRVMITSSCSFQDGLVSWLELIYEPLPKDNCGVTDVFHKGPPLSTQSQRCPASLDGPRKETP